MDRDLVREAQTDELKAMEAMMVWGRLGPGGFPNQPVVPTKWVLTNTGDSEKMDVRARLVVCEVKGAAASEAQLFAAAPPLESLRCLISLAASDKRKHLDFIDVQRAHRNGTARRTVVIRLPPEAGGGTAVLLRSMYGTRDAAACWEACITKVMQKLGFVQGKSSPCLFYHSKKDISVFVHGDDFVSLGSVEMC